MIVLGLGAAGLYAYSATRPSVAQNLGDGDYQLVTATGETFTRESLVGSPSMLFFGFTHCPEVCPTTLFEMNGWLEKVDPEGNKLQAYFISVDPERDTPDVLGQYVSNVSKRVIGISGPPAGRS